MRGFQLLLLMAFLHVLAADEASDIAQFKADLKVMLRETMMEQTNNEETTKRNFNSGLLQVRQLHDGTDSYHVGSVSNARMMGMHDHADYQAAVGLGELTFNLNGVIFKTPNMVYSLQKPSTTSDKYGEVEDIEFPEVPQAVLDKRKVDEQIEEMRLWFKAFKEQDYSTRDYRDHFKPILCYLEAGWMSVKDTHAYDDFLQVSMFNENTGHQVQSDLDVMLPTRIMEIVNDTTPVIGQWDYRILCHPLKKFLHQDRMLTVDDFHLRLLQDKPLKDYETSPKARFRLNVDDTNVPKEGVFRKILLDNLMEEIPGPNNYEGKLYDDAYGDRALDPQTTSKPCIASNYHRWYANKDPNNEKIHQKHRGFNDPQIFMALTTQPEVASFKVEDGCKVRDGKRACSYSGRQRWVYAIPLEIIYLPPLSKWNPYRIYNRGAYDSYQGRKTTAGGRDGGLENKKAFSAINSRNFYMTPPEFYDQNKFEALPGDTPKKAVVGVLKGNRVVNVSASGISTFTQYIPGVGRVRLRYPIVHLAEEERVSFKDVTALKKFVLKPTNYRKIEQEKHDMALLLKNQNPYGWYQLGYSTEVQSNVHSHKVYISSTDTVKLFAGKILKKTAAYMNRHRHTVEVKYVRSSNMFVYSKCDGKSWCPGRHAKELRRIVNV